MRAILMSVNSHPSSSATPRKAPRQHRSARTVAHILDAAARIFEERGYSGTTTNHVAEAAGVSIGSVYQYFPNKDALLVGLESRHLDHAATELSLLADRWRADEPDPQQWANSFVSALVVLNDSPLHLLIYDLAPGLPELRSRVDAIVTMMTTELAGHLRRWGVRRSADLRARLTVVAALALVHDVIMRLPSAQRATARRETVQLLVGLLVARH